MAVDFYRKIKNANFLSTTNVILKIFKGYYWLVSSIFVQMFHLKRRMFPHSALFRTLGTPDVRGALRKVRRWGKIATACCFRWSTPNKRDRIAVSPTLLSRVTFARCKLGEGSKLFRGKCE